MPDEDHSQIPAPQAGGIIKVVLLYATFSALWILLSDKAVEWLFQESWQITLASTFKGWLFVALTSLLLYGLMRRMIGRTADEAGSTQPNGMRPLIPLIPIAVVIVVLTAGSIVYTFKLGEQKEAGRLLAIADLKTGQIVDWLRERESDAHAVQNNRFFAEAFRRWRSAGDASSGIALKKRLEELLEDKSFQSVLLLDGQNEVLWDSDYFSSASYSVLSAAVHTRAPDGVTLRIGPYRDDNGRLRLDFIIPLTLIDLPLRPSIVLRVDPSTRLFPILENWPLPSVSGETLLFRKDGDEVLFLNEPRRGKVIGAMYRMPLAEKQLLAARALRGEVKQGNPVEGTDYRGIPVMGVIRPVPGTDWFLAVELDREELHAAPIQDALWIALSGVLALFTAAAGTFLFRQHRELVLSQRERKAQEEKLRALQLLDAIAEGSGDAIFAKDMEGRYLFFNQEAARIAGKSREYVLGLDDFELFPSEQAEILRENDRKVMESDRTVTFQEDLTTADGSITFLSIKGPLHDAKGNVMGMLGISRDITERKRAEETLKESEEKFRLTFQTSPDSININRLSDGLYLDINDGFTGILGYTREDVMGKTSLELSIWVNPEDRERLVDSLRSVGFIENLEAEFRGKDGRIRTGLMSARLLRINQEDVVLSITRDITERKEAEEERKRLESQLFHAQKLESVGRLAGGVAHDFNNMLGVIIGHTELALDKVNPSESLYQHLQEVRRAAHRSADLTRQLLAFARRQAASPKVLDLNETISGMLNMLRRLIGEDIRLEWKPGTDLWKVRVDPSQIDQILANLTVNARDAIPGTGAITLSTENTLVDESGVTDQEGLRSGPYVMLIVSDTGSGMDREVLDHIFEPFFTTKGVGQGTGLGLATVYGIVRQNNGFLKVFSTPGAGTTFRVYLPGLEDTAADDVPEEQNAQVQGGRESILVVEDDEGMLSLSKSMLERLGYTVHVAAGPGQAVDIVKERPELDLLISDVVMPEMNGRELVDVIRALRPQLKFIHMSGYTADVIARQGVMEEGIHFIQKPFSLNELSRKVREVLKD